MIKYNHHIDYIKSLSFSEFKENVFEKYPDMNHGILTQLFRRFSMKYPEIIHPNEEPITISQSNQRVYRARCIEILDEFISDLDSFLRDTLKDDYDPELYTEFEKTNKGTREGMIDEKIIDPPCSDFSHKLHFEETPHLDPLKPDNNIPDHFPHPSEPISPPIKSKFVLKNHPPPINGRTRNPYIKNKSTGFINIVDGNSSSINLFGGA